MPQTFTAAASVDLASLPQVYCRTSSAGAGGHPAPWAR